MFERRIWNAAVRRIDCVCGEADFQVGEWSSKVGVEETRKVGWGQTMKGPHD